MSIKMLKDTKTKITSHKNHGSNSSASWSGKYTLIVCFLFK